MEKQERTAKEQFDRQAVHYDAEWNTWSQATLDWLLTTSQPAPGDRVLDIATGAGFTAIAFAKKAAHVTGSDVSVGMLEQARKFALAADLANIDFVEAPAEELPFDDQQFDIATCRIAAHHFTGIAAFAQEAYRTLRPGGKLLVADTSVPDSDFLAAIWQNEVERLRDPSHVRNYTLREWERILTHAGFEIASITDSGDGIRIPLSIWLHKAGCTPEQQLEVRKRFDDAAEHVRRAFKITTDGDGETYFTWMRVLVLAVKAA